MKKSKKSKNTDKTVGIVYTSLCACECVCGGGYSYVLLCVDV